MKKDFSDKSAEECDKLAFERVVRSLTASEQSSKKLRKKMELEGYPSSSIDYALDRATNIGILDDVRYCDMIVSRALTTGKGMYKCMREIEELGVNPEDIYSYSEYLEQGQEGEIERAVEYLKRHSPKAKDVRSSAFRKLVSRGYSFEVASKATSEYMDFLKEND